MNVGDLILWQGQVSLKTKYQDHYYLWKKGISLRSGLFVSGLFNFVCVFGGWGERSNYFII